MTSELDKIAAEALAVKKIKKAIEPLDEDSRARVVRAIHAAYAPPAPAHK